MQRLLRQTLHTARRCDEAFDAQALPGHPRTHDFTPASGPALCAGGRGHNALEPSALAGPGPLRPSLRTRTSATPSRLRDRGVTDGVTAVTLETGGTLRSKSNPVRSGF